MASIHDPDLSSDGKVDRLERFQFGSGRISDSAVDGSLGKRSSIELVVRALEDRQIEDEASGSPGEVVYRRGARSQLGNWLSPDQCLRRVSVNVICRTYNARLDESSISPTTGSRGLIFFCFVRVTNTSNNNAPARLIYLNTKRPWASSWPVLLP